MKRLVLILCLVGSAAFADERPPIPSSDSWKGQDKIIHFGVSGILGFSARTFYPQEPWKAVGVAMIPGLLKEATDQKFSGKDLAVDFAGALFGVYVGGCYITHNRAVCGWKF